LAGFAEVWVERDPVHRHVAKDDLLHLAGRDQEPHFRAPERYDREVSEIRAKDLPHKFHRLTARGPAPDPDRHAGFKLAHRLCRGHALIRHLNSSLENRDPTSDRSNQAFVRYRTRVATRV